MQNASILEILYFYIRIQSALNIESDSTTSDYLYLLIDLQIAFFQFNRECF
jgi:hypothetical protein